MNPEQRRLAMDKSRPGLIRSSACGPGLGVRAALLLALFAAVPCCGQVSNQLQQSPDLGQTTHSQRNGTSTIDQSNSGAIGDPVFQERRLRQLSAAQHKAMVSDTDKLLRLVTELNAEINSTYPASLTLEQLRKVAEIEKLAHSVRDKMRTSVVGAPTFLDSGPLPPSPHSSH